jgi:hypothetical protein
VDRLLEPRSLEQRHGRKHAGDEALHIACPAAVELAVPRGECEGIARPALPLDGHAVAVSREPDTALAGSNRSEKVRLGAVGRRDQRRLDAVNREIALYVIYELKIGSRARRVEADEKLQELCGCLWC